MSGAGVFPRIYAFLAIFFKFGQRNYAPWKFNILTSLGCDFLPQSSVWHLCNAVNNFRMDKKCAQLWQRLSAALKPQISADSFKRWFSTVELIEAKDKSITLTVPTTSTSFGSRVITC